jgi:hypothetical protein
MARGHDIPPRAERRIRQDHTNTATDEFDNGLLRDGVWEDVLVDTQLAQLEDAIATAENARERRRGELDDTSEDHGTRVAAGMDDLQSVVRQRVLELCAERAHTILEDGDQWVTEGHVDSGDLAAAQHEAAGWLREHPDVCQRVFNERTPSILDDQEATA